MKKDEKVDEIPQIKTRAEVAPRKKRGRKALTDDKVREILEDYIVEKNYLRVAKMHGVSNNTVRRLVNTNPELIKEGEEEADKIADDIMLKLRVNCNKIFDLTDAILNDTLRRKDKLIAAASLQQRATVYAIFMDKLLKYKEMTYKEKELEYKERALKLKEQTAEHLSDISNINVNNYVQIIDDMLD